MTNDDIAIQREADEWATGLRRDGRPDVADFIIRLRQWGYGHFATKSAAMTALRGGFPMETER